jgi:hypothetical protein
MINPKSQTNRPPQRLATSGVLLFGILTIVGCQPSGSEPVVAEAETQSKQALSPDDSVLAVEPDAPQDSLAEDNGQGQTTSSAQPQGNKRMDDLNAFAVNGTTILASETGDLNGDGRSDALVVLDPPEKGGEEADKGVSRTVLLLIRDANGVLQKVGQNDTIVPCSRCGGLLGDPFGYIRIDKDGFTVVIEGGSRQRWSSEYTFQYTAQSNDWHLWKVERGAYDQISEERISKTFTRGDFGQIAFSDFDPSEIPEVVLP